MAFVGLFMLLFVGLWLVNWFAVTVVTGALGLRRRRWGTPGGGWTMVSAALAGVSVGFLILMTFLGGVLVGPGPGMEWVLLGIFVLALALWTASHLAQAWALMLAWRAADEAQTLRFRTRSSD